MKRRQFVALGALGLPLHAAAATLRPRWRLAVVPQLTPVEVHSAWAPVVEALEREGVSCELVVASSIARFESEFLDGSADLVFLNPYHMVMARKVHGYIPLLRDAGALEGVLLVHRDSPVQRISELQGRRISFPAPNAFAASLYIRAVLAREHQLRYQAHFASNHRNAIRQVLVGDSAAAGVVRRTYEMEAEEVRSQLRVLYATPAVAPHPLAAHPRVPATVRNVIAQTMARLGQTTEGQAILKAIQIPNPIAADFQRDYAPLQRLKVEQFVVTP